MNSVLSAIQPGYEAGNVLILEDDQLMVDLLLLYLQEADYFCRVVNSAEDAWDILKTDADVYDCVLLDRNLPGLSGLELLQKIKST